MVRNAFAALLALPLVVAACSGSGAPAVTSRPSTVIESPRATATTVPIRSIAPSFAATSAPSTLPTLVLLPKLPTAPLDQATSTALQRVLDTIVEEGAPDVIAAVITEHGQWSGAAGIDGPGARRATADDVFALASITKTPVATLILRLSELGLVDLDAPLATYLPGHGDLTNGATVRQALTMRAGIGETDGSVVAKALADCTRAWTREDVFGAFPAPVGAPGAAFSYSNPGYKLLGYVAEAVTGTPLSSALRKYVLDPAHADRMLLQAAGTTTPGRWALPVDGHLGELSAADYGKGGTLPCLSDSTLSVGGTAMAGDVRSLARWAWTLFAGGIIRADSLAVMTTVGPDAYGAGIWKLSDFAPAVAFGHAGNKPGYAPVFAVLPERRIVIVLCINDQDADPYTPANRLLHVLGA